MKIPHEIPGTAKRNAVLVPALVFALVFMTSTPCHAGKILVFTEPLAPVHFEEDGQIRGIGTEVVQAIFEEAGLEPKIEIYPWKRAYQKVLSNDGSFIYTINRTEKRENLLKWIGPIFPKKVYLYRLKSRDDIQLDTLEDAKKYTTAVILGHSLTTMLQDRGFREGKELITTPNKKVQIKFFLKGRCDLITGNEYTIYESLKAEGYSLDHVEPAVFISSEGYFLGANKNVSDNVVEKLRKANVRIQESGIVEKIIIKYIH
jgi:polar amino acid transport system substrate-binding protein